MEESIDHFVAFTGATTEVARRYLGLTENHTEQAIQLFFDSPDLASGVDQIPQAAAPPVPTNTRPQIGAQRAAPADSDDEDLMDMDYNDGSDDEATRAAAIGRAAEIEDDEAMARRMQEEMYAGGDASGGFDADGVRAPIGRRTETLVGGPDADWAPDDIQAAVLQQMRARQSRPCMFSCFQEFYQY